MNSQEILVSVQLGAENIRVGTLWCHVGKGRERERLARDRFRPSMAEIDSHNGAGYWLPRPPSSPETPRPSG